MTELSEPLPGTGNGAGPPLSTPHVARSCPPVVSARGTLRGALPAIYQDPPDGLAMRFVQAFERVLDPRVAVLDCRASYLAPDLAPDDIVDALVRWLGFEPSVLPRGAARRVLEQAAPLSRLRATRAGLELLLRCCFPGLQVELDDGGGAIDATELRPDRPPGALVIRCRPPLAADEREALVRVLERHRPVHIDFRLQDGGDAPAGEHARH
jgi:phage tail-like protein